jgi:hypothetical protein
MVDDNMVCSDILDSVAVSIKPSGGYLVPTDGRLSALSPSERKNFLDSVACHKDMLEELAKM